MPILYSCVAQGQGILVEYTSSSGEGNYSQVASSALHNIPTNSDYKTIYEAEQYMLFVYVKSGITYLCAADKDYSKRKAYDHLLDIIEKTEACTADRTDSQHYELAHQQKEDITRFMKSSAAQPKASKLDKLQEDVDELQEIMIHNIEQILSRGERLEDLQERTELLEVNAQVFANTTREINRNYWYKNVRYKILLGVGLIVAGAILLLTIVVVI